MKKIGEGVIFVTPALRGPTYRGGDHAGPGAQLKYRRGGHFRGPELRLPDPYRAGGPSWCRVWQSSCDADVYSGLPFREILPLQLYAPPWLRPTSNIVPRFGVQLKNRLMDWAFSLKNENKMLHCSIGMLVLILGMPSEDLIEHGFRKV